MAKIWFNNFCQFEKKQKGVNRLALNFYSLSSKANIKVFLKQSVKIPTSFIFDFEEVKKAIAKVEKIKKDYEAFKDKITLKLYLGKLHDKKELEDIVIPIEQWNNKFSILEVEVPYHRELIKRLPAIFQKGNYDKLLRFNCFYPERKVSLDEKIEKIFEEISNFQDKKLEKQNGDNFEIEKISSMLKEIDPGNKIYFDSKTKDYEIELNSLDGIYFNEFLTEKDLESLVTLEIDIEKPLWKKKEEKELIKKREKLKKDLSRLEKKHAEKEKIDKIKEEISSIEEKLTIDTKFGKIKLYEDLFDAKISFVSTIWKTKTPEGKIIIKELYMLDPFDDFKQEKFNGFVIKKFKTEKELVGELIKNIKLRKPIICYGHNEAYDITQIRFAAETTKAGKFDPVKDEQVRRDYVRKFYQRLREDMIYFDTLWLNRIFFPFLALRSLNQSLKLEDVAKFHGIAFKKTISHEDLRNWEITRLAGNEEQRKKASEEMVNYSIEDIEIVDKILERIPICLILKLKRIMPYLTLTKLAFSTSCSKEYFENKHFKLYHNMKYHGYSQKQREDEVQIFKKNFRSKKKELLKWSGIKVGLKSKAHNNNNKSLYQIYLPFEEWIKEAVFQACPEFKSIYEEFDSKDNKIENNIEKFGFLQYMKVLAEQILVDYYFARNYKKEYEKILASLKRNSLFENSEIEKKISTLEKIKDDLNFNKYITLLNVLKDRFRSIYTAPGLDKETRKKLRLTKSNLKTLKGKEQKPYIAEFFLLYNLKDEIIEKLNDKKKSTLKRFIKNFENFLELSKNLSENLNISEDLLYAYYCKSMAEKREKKFEMEYGLSIEKLKEMIGEAYKKLKEELSKANAIVVEIKNDYLFVKASEEIEKSKHFYIIRKFAQES
ncbi:MAG: hypothetical protein QXS77_02070 [Candidatus Pacearchaeota archaeon]